MSYEGYTQVLCRSGHAHSVYGFMPKLWYCLDCKELAGWVNHVDDTNDDEVGKIELVEVSPAEYKTCDLGHEHKVKVAVYKPSRVGGRFVNGGLKV